MEKGGPNFWVRISTQLPWSCGKLLYLVECRCKIHLVSGLKIRMMVKMTKEVLKKNKMEIFNGIFHFNDA